MGTEVLRPHDCLIDRIGVPPATVIPRRRSSHHNNRHFNHLAKPRRSKPSPAISRRYSSDDLRQSKIHHNHNHNQKYNRENRNPQTAMVPNQIWIGNRSRSLSPKQIGDRYAGSAISVSPSPESLPLPSFSMNKQQLAVIVDDSALATRDLRRLLRLDG